MVFNYVICVCYWHFFVGANVEFLYRMMRLTLGIQFQGRYLTYSKYIVFVIKGPKLGLLN